MVEIEGKELKSFKFSGGEIQVKIPLEKATVNVKATLRSSDDILELIMVSEAINGYGMIINNLEIPYLPYARQDRRCDIGEAFSLKVMAKIINDIGAKKVIVWDVHSGISEALINNLENVSQSDLMGNCIELERMLGDKEYSICSPDAGALKKIHEVQKIFSIPNDRLITALKERDVTTGQITNTEVYHSHPFVLGSVVIIDDICDGGRTFIELAKKLRNEGFSNIILYVTHGIFSKGFDCFDGLIDHIYTTDSFCTKKHKSLTTIRRVKCIETDQVQL